MSQTIKKSDLELILSGAAALQTRELSGEAVRKLLDLSQEDLPISAVYEFAEDVVGIPREYIKRYAAMRFPSRERKIDTIRNINGQPTWEALIITYGNVLLEELKKGSPLENFDLDVVPRFSVNFLRKFDIERRGFFGKKYKVMQNELLAGIIWKVDGHTNREGGYYYDNERLEFNLFSPFFAEVCSNKIKELGELFKESKLAIRKINYHYPLS